MKKLLSVTLLTLIPNYASAHCPLCTAGAGILAVTAASLGISSVVVGIFVGAFALALGLWMSGLVKKQYIPFQKHLLTAGIYAVTIIPIMPLVRDYSPLYISIWGKYGSVLHNTYTLNLFLFGAVIGAIVVLISPTLSRSITRFRGKNIPYQGLILTLILLVVSSVIVHIFS